MAALYLLAGVNHFRSPGSYHSLIPPWIGHVETVNILAGIAEIVLAILLLFKPTRKWAAYGIILMLLAFIPTHIYMIQEGLGLNGSTAPAWILWVRLLVFQPLLILWAWYNRK
jgi:uncharacterized membrane protein